MRSWKWGIAVVPLLACQSAPDKEISNETPIPPPTCAADPAAPRTTWNLPRQTVPWTLVLAVADGGAPAGDTGEPGDGGGGADSGCVTAPPPARDSVTCRGSVVVRRAGGDLDLRFSDGSVLRWDPGAGATVITPPILADGQSAWVDYQRYSTLVCPFCGAYQTELLQVRATADSPLLWIGREGGRLPEVSADRVLELFGAPASARRTCGERFSEACWMDVNREVFDHLLHTTPEQPVPSAVLSHVTTARGEYDVFWTHTVDQGGSRVPLCADGPDLASDNAFAANRTAPPAVP